MARLVEGSEPSTREGAGTIGGNEDVGFCQDQKPSIKRSTSSSVIFESRSKRDILDIVGGSGPWQWKILLIMTIATIPGATLNFSMTFLAPEIDHWCAKPPDIGNVSLEQWKEDGLPPGDEKKCYRYENRTFGHKPYDNTSDENSYRIIPCDSWDYDNSFYSSTILEQWNLVCDREWMVSLSRSLFMAGILVGTSVFGYSSDKLGRRLTISICCILMVSFAFICAFSVSFTMFMIARCMVAVGIGGYYTTFFVLLMEVSSPKMRSVYGMGVQFGWCFGYVCLPGIAWLLRDWFWIQIALTAPCIFFFGIWWIIPESPRWLLAQGRVKEARRVLKKAGEANNINLSKMDSALDKLMEEATEAHKSGETTGNILDLLITPGLWKITLNVFLLWFVNAFVYFGLSFNTNELEGDPFITFALSGLVEFPAYLLSIFVMNRLGRRIPIAVAMISAGTACVLAYPLPADLGWARTAVSIIGKFFIASSFGMVYVFTTELFPTVLRNTGIGSAALCEGIGSAIAPFSKELGDATHPVIPLLVIGVLSLVSGILVLFLPETHNCVVPDTLKEAAEASRKKEDEKMIVKKRAKHSRNSVAYVIIPLQENVHSSESGASGLPCYEDTMLFQPSSLQ